MDHKDWKEYYNQKIITVQEAVKFIKSGDFIVDGHGAGRPDIFAEEMINRANELENVRLTTGSNIGINTYCKPEYAKSFRHVSLFNTGTSIEPVAAGRADFVPCTFSQVDKIIAQFEPDILFTMVTPPNEDGYVSMGVSVDFTRYSLDVSKLVIAQVNNNMPWTNGDAIVHVSEIDYFVIQDTKLPQIPFVENPSEVDRNIAKYVAEYIKDGDTLQIGIGSIPDTVLSLLENHKHLGIHSEMGTTGIAKMMKKGVIDNSMKSIDKGKTVCTLMAGTQELYDYINNNPAVEMRRSTSMLNPTVIAQFKNFVAINAAVQIDLLGQVCAESMNGTQISGVGGQLDFLRGAMMAEGGKSFICLPSTAARGTVSRIVPYLDKNNVVTDTRYDVMYVVTEYGVVNLFGKTIDERAKALISIAHPDFREQLQKDYYEQIRGFKS